MQNWLHPADLLRLLVLTVSLFSGCPVLEASTSNVTFHVEENGPQPLQLVGSVQSGGCQAPFNSFNIPNEALSLDRESGNVRTQTRLDRELQAAYTFDVICSTSIVHVLVVVDDKNDCYPTFQNATLVLHRPENIPTPTALPLMYVEDLDSEPNSIDRVEITAGNADNRFAVQQRQQVGRPTRFDLVLVLQTPLDYESASSYSLQLTAYDKRGLTGTANVVLNVNNVNDESPVFTQSLYQVNVTENTTIGTEVIQVRANDRDLGEFNTVRYYINNEVSDPDRHFAMDPVTGSIRLAKTLDYELRQLYSIVVVATDGVNNGSANVVVRVIDVNDRPPQVTLLNLTTGGQVLQSAVIGQPVMRIEVTDPDRPLDPVQVVLSMSTFEFKLTALDKNIFVIQVNSSLSPQLYIMTLTAIDSGDPPLTTTVSIGIQVLASNDHAPEFTKVNYHATVGSSTSSGFQVVQVQAADPDRTTVSYSMTPASASDAGFFDINLATGWITVGSKRLVCGSFAMQIHAADSGSPPRVSNATLVVFVTDSNQYWPRFQKPFYSVTLPKAGVTSCFSQVHATDRDCGAALSYSFSENVSSAYGSLFTSTYSVDSYTGYICVSNASNALAFGNLIQLPIRVLDSAAGVAKASYSLFQLSISDIGPSAPNRFPLTNYRIDLSESYPTNVAILSVAAIGGADYSLVSSSSYFTMFGNGTLALASSLDYETGPRAFSLTIVSGASLSANLIISVSVLDENDNYPNCSVVEKSLAVADNSPQSTQIIQFACTDPDTGPGLVYTADFDNFAVSSGGSLTVKNSITHLAGQTVTLPVKVCDPDMQCVNFTTSVRVIDTNDHSPEFSQPAGYWFRTPENVSPGTALGTVLATDMDLGLNAAVKYRLIDPSGSFTIGELSGTLKTSAPLDRETLSSYSLKVEAYDVGSPSRTATVQVAVIVTDVNDVAPKFRLKSYAVSATDQTPAAASLLVVDATDPDLGLGATLSFSLSGPVSEYLSVNRVTGVLSTVKRLTPGHWIGQLTVSDGGDLTDTSQLSLTVSRVPVWPNSSVLMTASESAKVGHLVGQIKAPSTKAYYTLQAAADGAFWVSVNSGKIYVNRPLDREAVSVHTYEILVTDATERAPGRPQSSTVSLTISILDENDNAPRIGDEDLSPTISVAEDLPGGSLIHTFSVTDPDLGLNGTIAYFLAEPTALFAIDEKAGKLVILQSLDRETLGEATQIGVFVTDRCQTVPLCSKTRAVIVTIVIKDVNDHAPSLSFDTGAFYLSTDKAGAIISHVEGVDNDPGLNGTLSFSVSPADAVAIDEFGLVRLLAAGTATVAVNASATDSGPLSSRQTNWRSTDIPFVSFGGADKPKFQQSIYSTSISSRAAQGQDVVLLDAQKRVGSLEFRLPYGLYDNLFSIDPVIGQVRLARPLPDDYRLTYRLTGLLADKASRPSRLGTTEVAVNLVDANEHAPVFLSAYYTDVPEGQAYSGLLTLAAYDLDRGPAGEVTYAIEGSGGLQFILDPKSGELSCSALDSSAASQYLLNVTATDGGGLVGRTTVTVRVLPVNRFAPTFQRGLYTTAVSENAPVGASVLNVTATDRDAGVNGRVTYSLLGKPDTVGIDPDTGEIRLARRLDKELESFVSASVIATDYSQENPMSSMVNVEIEVLDANDERPVFQTAYYYYQVSAPLAPGALLTTLRATDADSSPVNSAVKYSIESNDLLSVDETSGRVTLLRSLAASPASVSFHSFEVRARDTGLPAPLTSVTRLVVQLGSPSPALAFAYVNHSAALPENSPAGACPLSDATAACLTVSTVLPASRYAIVAGNEEGKFAINPLTGAITVATTNASALDYETRHSYRLVVQASTAQQAALTRVDIRLSNRDDCGPRFAQLVYAAVLPEKSPAGAPVARVWAIDDDSRVKYRLLSGGGGGGGSGFAINEDTGLVTVATPPDYSLQSNHSLAVVAASEDDPLMTAKCTLLVRIVNLNNQKPLLQPTPDLTLAADARPGQRLTQIRATDLDGYPPLAYSLAIEPSTHSTVFAIGRFSGDLWLVGKPDRSDFNLSVTVVDGGEHSASGSFRVRLNASAGGAKFVRGLFFFAARVGASLTDPVGTLELVGGGGGGGGGGVSLSIVADPTLPQPPPFQLVGLELRPSRAVLEAADFAFVVKATLPLSSGSTTTSADFATVLVSYQASNSRPPAFRNVSAATGDIVLTVSEATPIGRAVGVAVCVDEDAGQTTSVEVVAAAGSEPPPVQAVRHTGRLVLTKRLDRESQAEHRFQVACWDSGLPSLGVNATVRVLVQDANDNAPKFVGDPYATSVVASTAAATVGSRLLTVAANDPDVGINGQVTYRLLGNGTLLGVDSASGGVSLLSTPPEVQIDASDSAAGFVGFEFLVRASDVRLSSLARLSLRVLTDAAASAPSLPANPLALLVSEGLAAGSLVSDKLPTDCAVEPASPEFELKSGRLTTLRMLDYENTTAYSLRLNCSAGAERQQLLMLVQDVDEFQPVFDLAEYRLNLASTPPIGQSLIRLAASDRDAGSAGRVAFSLTGVDCDADSEAAAGRFSVNTSTGEVYLARAFNAAAADGTVLANYSLRVRASSVALFTDAVVQLTMPVPLEMKPPSTGLAAPPLAAILAGLFVLVAIIVVAVVVAVCVHRRRQLVGKRGLHSSRAKRREAAAAAGAANSASPNSTLYDSCFDQNVAAVVAAAAAGLQPPRPPPRTMTELTRLSGTAHSSGLGSAASDEDHQSQQLHHHQQQQQQPLNFISTGQTDGASLPKDHREYLHRLGVTPELRPSPLSAGAGRRFHSAASLWSEDPYQATPVPSLLELPRAAAGAAGFGGSNGVSGVGGFPVGLNTAQPRLPSHLTAWQPQFQPLASVFAEIAQLKDDANADGGFVGLYDVHDETAFSTSVI